MSCIYKELNVLYGECFIHQFNAICFTHYPELSEFNISNTLIKQLNEKSSTETIKFKQIADYVSLSKTQLKYDDVFEVGNHNNFRKRRSLILINYGKNKIRINQQDIDNQNNKPYLLKSSYIKIGKFKISSSINDGDKNNIISLNSLYNYIIYIGCSLQWLWIPTYKLWAYWRSIQTYVTGK